MSSKTAKYVGYDGALYQLKAAGGLGTTDKATNVSLFDENFDSEGELQYSDFERPQHRVRIARPFAIGRHALTFDDYDAFCDRQAAANAEAAGSCVLRRKYSQR